MGTSLLKLQEARHAGISSRLGKLHTDARLAVQMILAYSAAGVTIPRTILDIWCTSVSRWVIVVAVTVGTLRHGGFRYIARYIHRMKGRRNARGREKPQVCLRSWQRQYV
jgi:hypothetical protein